MNDFAIKILTARPGQTHLFAAGQAGYIIKSKTGQLLAIDLYLSDCVERAEGVGMGFKRLLPKILSPCDLELDVLIATHPHLDHFDIDTVPAAMGNGRTRLFASTDCDRLVKGLLMTDQDTAGRVTYVRPGESYSVGDFRLDFVNCDHGSGAPDAVGVVVAVDGKRIYEAGDTCLRLDRAGEVKAVGPLDVLIAPINGAFGNLNEEDCARLSGALAPKITIPCHYGMFAAHGGNPGRFLEIMRERLPENRVLLMAQGEGYTL